MSKQNRQIHKARQSYFVLLFSRVNSHDVLEVVHFALDLGTQAADVDGALPEGVAVFLEGKSAVLVVFFCQFEGLF
jgi:hypothetical protein